MRYALGDIHGCFNTLRFMIEDRIKLSKSDHLYLLGDYIDRGPWSKQVIQYLIDLLDGGYQIHPLKGNHEDMMLRSVLDKNSMYTDVWIRNNAKQTIESYGLRSLDLIKFENTIASTHMDFFKKLQNFIELEDHILVHAGFDFSKSDPFSDTNSMLWIRHFVVDPAKSKNKTIVHGHTPVDQKTFKHSIGNPDSHKICIDTGCVYTSYHGMGYLTALNLDTHKYHQVKNRDN